MPLFKVEATVLVHQKHVHWIEADTNAEAMKAVETRITLHKLRPLDLAVSERSAVEMPSDAESYTLSDFEHISKHGMTEEQTQNLTNQALSDQ